MEIVDLSPFLVNIVTTSKALVTRSDALVPNSFLFSCHLSILFLVNISGLSGLIRWCRTAE